MLEYTSICTVMHIFQTISPTWSDSTFQYLYGMPIQLTAYGHMISYGTIGTALSAIMAALASKIFLQEMSKIIDWRLCSLIS